MELSGGSLKFVGFEVIFGGRYVCGNVGYVGLRVVKGGR